MTADSVRDVEVGMGVLDMMESFLFAGCDMKRGFREGCVGVGE